jgi:hypothetical protein
MLCTYEKPGRSNCTGRARVGLIALADGITYHADHSSAFVPIVLLLSVLLSEAGK